MLQRAHTALPTAEKRFGNAPSYVGPGHEVRTIAIWSNSTVLACASNIPGYPDEKGISGRSSETKPDGRLFRHNRLIGWDDLRAAFTGWHDRMIVALMLLAPS
jgi:hypothetical protein